MSGRFEPSNSHEEANLNWQTLQVNGYYHAYNGKTEVNRGYVDQILLS